MAQILDPIPSDNIDSFECCYVNATSQIQVARITNIPNWYFERVVFPGQRLVFKALSTALLEIHCGMMATAIVSDTIPCENLRVNQVSFGELKIAPVSVPDRSKADRETIPQRQKATTTDNKHKSTVATLERAVSLC